MTEYERIREEIAKLLCSEDGWDWEQINEEYRHLGDSIARSTYRGIAAQILSLDGIEIRADSQDLNESSHFIWPQTTQSKEEMLRYQTGEIDKEEHNKQQGQIIDEELAIYYKAQQDMLKPDSEGKHWVRVIPKGR